MRWPWRRQPRGKVRIRLLFEDGPPVLLGPMDRLTADVLLVNHFGPWPFHHGRRIVSARIIGD